MTLNRVQFQPGRFLPEFYRPFGTGEACAEALEQARWPKDFGARTAKAPRITV